MIECQAVFLKIRLPNVSCLMKFRLSVRLCRLVQALVETAAKVSSSKPARQCQALSPLGTANEVEPPFPLGTATKVLKPNVQGLSSSSSAVLSRLWLKSTKEFAESAAASAISLFHILLLLLLWRQRKQHIAAAAAAAHCCCYWVLLPVGDEIVFA